MSGGKRGFYFLRYRAEVYKTMAFVFWSVPASFFMHSYLVELQFNWELVMRFAIAVLFYVAGRIIMNLGSAECKQMDLLGAVNE